MDTKITTGIPGLPFSEALEICTTKPADYPEDLSPNWTRIEATLERAVWARVVPAPTTPGVKVVFGPGDAPANWNHESENFEDWLDNASGQLESSLIAHGNDWIETMAGIDGFLNEDQD